MKKLLLAAAGVVALTGMTAPAALAEKGDWQFRVRAITVQPDEGADIQTIGGDVDIDTSVVPEFDISYFFTDNIAAELILGVTPHDVMAVDTAVGDLDLGDVTLLPPTLTLQYHFNPAGKVRPYLGAGVNYTTFFNEDLPNGSALSTIDYDDSFGLAAQAGLDYALENGWLVNFDVKYIDINTDVLIDGAISADVDIDPVIFGIGIGRTF
ncbi:MAG TPA: OmpW family protein [Oceanicaulis sp.]|nr:OmpW family protein [Oceanicaulis sp.]